MLELILEQSSSLTTPTLIDQSMVRSYGAMEVEPVVLA